MKNVRGKPKNNLPRISHEKTSWASKNLVCGLDEVGRGCLAGPLVTSAVILHLNKKSNMIQDSKLLSSRQLEKAAAWIKENSWYAYGIVHNRAIDQHNIWQSTLLGMQTAIINLLAHCPQLPATILVDAMPLNLEKTVYSTIPIHSMIRGEQESISIAAASILAKVKRDEMMRRYDTIFPGFSFGDHKGYATAVHLEALQAQEQTIIHRNSFLKKFNMRKLLAQKELQNQQISLFDPISTPTQEALLSSPSYPTPIKIKQTRVQK